MKLHRIIIKYDKILDKYVRTDIIPSAEFFNKEKSKYDFILQRVISFYYIANYISSLKTKAYDANDSSLFTIFNKASLDLLGIFVCLGSGLEVQAGIISRSLYEAYITTALIFKEETKERIKLFSNFQHVLRWKKVLEHLENEGEEYFKNLEDKDAKFKLWEEKYNECIGDYNESFPYHWAYKIFKDKIKKNNPSFLDICKYLGDDFVKDYNTSYGTLSVQSHPSSIVGDYYTVVVKGKKRNVNSPMYKETIVDASVLAISHCELIVEKIVRYFRIGDCNDLISYMRFFVDSTFTIAKSFKDNLKLQKAKKKK